MQETEKKKREDEKVAKKLELVRLNYLRDQLNNKSCRTQRKPPVRNRFCYIIHGSIPSYFGNLQQKLKREQKQKLEEERKAKQDERQRIADEKKKAEEAKMQVGLFLSLCE